MNDLSVAPRVPELLAVISSGTAKGTDLLRDALEKRDFARGLIGVLNGRVYVEFSQKQEGSEPSIR